MTDAVGDAAKPSAVAMEGDRNLAFEQRDSAGVVIDTLPNSAKSEMSMKPDLGFALLFVGDLERLAFLADPGMLGLDDERQCLVRRNGDRPRRERRAGQRADLVGQADRHQRAARAFRTVLERRRDTALGDGQAQFADRRLRRRPQRLVEHDAHPLAALGIIDGAFLDAVAVLFEQQRLEADLDALRFIDALRNMRAPAALVIDRRHHAILGFRDIELGDDAQRRRGERQRPADNFVRRRSFVRCRAFPAPAAARSGDRHDHERACPRPCRRSPTIRPVSTSDRPAAGNRRTRSPSAPESAACRR